MGLAAQRGIMKELVCDKAVAAVMKERGVEEPLKARNGLGVKGR